LASGAFDDADELLFCVAAPFTLTVAGRFAEASEAIGLAISAAQRQGNLLNLAALPLLRGFLRLQLGALPAAEDDARPLADVALAGGARLTPARTRGRGAATRERRTGSVAALGRRPCDRRLAARARPRRGRPKRRAAAEGGRPGTGRLTSTARARARPCRSRR